MTNETSITGCELGPIRPPSEATSLLLRVTRNCPWNKCEFCAVYKRTRFSRRETDELIAEIDLLAEAAARVRELAAGRGEVGQVSSRTVLDVLHAPGSTEEEQRVALWLNRGGQHVFLQDADSLIIPPGRLVPVLEHLHARFPSVNRVTTYARSRTLVARSPEQLAELRRAGLTRIHVGVESGSDAVLELVHKGCRAEHHVDGCRKAVAGGFELCCYVMPGLGGRDLSADHARETARVLREIDPHHVRLRTLWIDRGSPLEARYRDGCFAPLEEDEIVAEIRQLLAGLKGASGHLISDHDRNLLADLEGHLTDDWEQLDELCGRFLDLAPNERDAYVVARRSGYFRSLGTFLADPGARETFAPVAAELRAAGDGSLLKGIERRMGRRGI
jgi:hypothetical protein